MKINVLIEGVKTKKELEEAVRILGGIKIKAEKEKETGRKRRRLKNKRISKETSAQIVKLVQEGKDHGQIARIVKLPKKKVYMHIRYLRAVKKIR